MQKVIKAQHPGIQGTNRVILMEMLIQASKDKRIWMSRQTLAEKAACSEKAVQKAYKLLQEHGLLVVERRGTGRSTYKFHFQEVENCPVCAAVTGSPQGGRTVPSGGTTGSPDNHRTTRSTTDERDIVPLKLSLSETEASPNGSASPSLTEAAFAAQGQGYAASGDTNTGTSEESDLYALLGITGEFSLDVAPTPIAAPAKESAEGDALEDDP